MKLPEAPPELLQDTLPPNGSVTAPRSKATTEAPVVDGPRSEKTVLIPRVRLRKQRLRTVVIASVAAAAALLLLGAVLSSIGGDRPRETAIVAAPNHEVASPAPEGAQLATVTPQATRQLAPSAEARDARGPDEVTPSKVVEKRASSRPSSANSSAPKAPATPPLATIPTPAASIRGKQPWIDGL